MTPKERDKFARAMFTHLWRLANPEKSRESCRKYRLANPNKVRQGWLKYQLANREQCRERNQKYRLANLEKERERGRKYRSANPSVSRNWRITNAEKIREGSRKYYAANRENIQKRGQMWYRQNKDKAQTKCGRWRARRRKARIGCQKAVAKIYRRCQELREWFDVIVDHIIPLSKSGAHSAENLQIIYAFENGRKGSSLTYQPRVIFI